MLYIARNKVGSVSVLRGTPFQGVTYRPFEVACLKTPGGGGREVVLPTKSVMGMCSWMGSHFHNWIDSNGDTFLIELLEWGCTISGFLG